MLTLLPVSRLKHRHPIIHLWLEASRSEDTN